MKNRTIYLRLVKYMLIVVLLCLYILSIMGLAKYEYYLGQKNYVPGRPWDVDLYYLILGIHSLFTLFSFPVLIVMLFLYVVWVWGKNLKFNKSVSILLLLYLLLFLIPEISTTWYARNMYTQRITSAEALIDRISLHYTQYGRYPVVKNVIYENESYLWEDTSIDYFDVKGNGYSLRYQDGSEYMIINQDKKWEYKDINPRD